MAIMVIYQFTLQHEVAEHDYDDDDRRNPAYHKVNETEYPAWGAGGVMAGKFVHEIFFLYAPAGKEHHYQAAHGNEYIT